MTRIASVLAVFLGIGLGFVLLTAAFPQPRVMGGGSGAFSTYESVTPAGTVQGDAAAITKDVVKLGTGANQSGWILPLATANKMMILFATRSSNQYKLYPASGNNFTEYTADSPFQVNNSNTGSSTNGGIILLFCRTTGTWDIGVIPAVNQNNGNMSFPYNYVSGGTFSATTLQTNATWNVTGANITFAGTTGNNKITLTDNLASALDITEASNSYFKCTTTNGAELCTNSKPIKPLIATPVASAGTDNTNCGAIPAGTVALQVTGANGVKGACLPTTSSVTTCVRIMNQSALALNVYGAAADTNPTVNGGAGAAAYSQLAGTSLLYCNSGVDWLSY